MQSKKPRLLLHSYLFRKTFPFNFKIYILGRNLTFTSILNKVITEVHAWFCGDLSSLDNPLGIEFIRSEEQLGENGLSSSEWSLVPESVYVNFQSNYIYPLKRCLAVCLFVLRNDPPLDASRNDSSWDADGLG